jgi:hypothetical protein
MLPGVDVLGAPGWLIPLFRFVLLPTPPVPMPVVVVDEPPGADVMPAEPGLVVVVPTGGTPPVPGAVPTPAAPPCANV